MSLSTDETEADKVSDESNGNSWLTAANELLAAGKYSSVVELCRKRLQETTESESAAGRLLLATSLYRAGQMQSSEDELSVILAQEPNHLTALKLRGDIAFSLGDEWNAIASYQQVLQLDPTGLSLACEIKQPPRERTRTVTLRRSAEQIVVSSQAQTEKPLPLYSETLGDLYLAQGHPRLAMQVYRQLREQQPGRPGLTEKLAAAEEKFRESKG